MHPNSDKMFVSQIQMSPDDAGNLKQVCSGLRDYMTRDELEGRLVVIADNLKKCKLRGAVSEGMLLCGDESTNAGIVEPCSLACNDTSLIGRQVVLSGSHGDPPAVSRRIKNNEWLDVSSRLYVNTKAQVVYKDSVTGQEHGLCVHDTKNEEIPIVVTSVSPGSPVR